jgi:hypothetical protein
LKIASARLLGGVLGVLLAAHLTLLGFFPITSEDTWWHLKEGELYVTTHSLPDQDPFAFTTQGREWIKYSWLADIIFYLVFRAAGLSGLVLLRLVLLLLIALVSYRILRACGIHPYAAILLVYLASLALRFRLLIRPEILSFLLLLATLAILLRYQQAPLCLAYGLLPVFVIWVNVHGSYVFGLGLPGLVLLANLLPWNRMTPGWGRLRLDRARSFHLAVVVAALPIVGLLNPQGPAMLLFPFQQNRMIRLTTFTEWMEVWQLPRIGLTWWEVVIVLGLIVIAYVVAAILLLAWEGRFDPVGWGILLSMGSYAVFRSRAVPFFALTILPFLALALARVADHVFAGESPKSSQRLVRIGALACVLVLGASLLDQGFLSSRFIVGFGVRPHFFPEGAVSFMERHHLDGRVFNSYHFGGYLIWRRWPANQVFIDGRYDTILFDEALFETYVQAHLSSVELDRLSARYGVELLVLDATEGVRMRHINRHPDWARIYWDEVAEVFVRRGGRFADLIPSHEYRLTRSEIDLSYLAAYRGDPKTRERVLAELGRAVEDNPENVRAWLSLAQEYSVAGPAAAERRLEALDRCLALMSRAPHIAMVYADRAYALLQLGRLDEAKEDARRALRLQRDLVLPRWVLASAAERRGAWGQAREQLRDILTRLEPDDRRVQMVRERLNVVEEHLRTEGAR